MKTIKIVKEFDEFNGFISESYKYVYPEKHLNGVYKFEVEGFENEIPTLKTFKKHGRTGIDITFDYDYHNSIKISWQ